MKIVTVVGARPQFVKAAVVSRALALRSKVQEVLLHTGQHYDSNMSDIFFEEMQIPRPLYNLEVRESLHGAMTAKMLQGIEAVLLKEKPDAVLVYGDTNSTLAAALAAAKLHIPVAHVEAGLRSFTMQMPEEINRILTDKVSTLLFCPTQKAVDNLLAEGFDKNPFYHIHRTGDVMFDAAEFYFRKSTEAVIRRLDLTNRKYILATFHRAENTDDQQRLSAVVSALNELNETTPVIVPLHPRTAKLIMQRGLKTQFRVIEPVGYFDMLRLLHHCSLVITDSGGLQKEASFFKKYCVLMRNQTEWVELVANGLCEIAGADAKKITDIAERLINTAFAGEANLYGDGKAGESIADVLEKSFN